MLKIQIDQQELKQLQKEITGIKNVNKEMFKSAAETVKFNVEQATPVKFGSMIQKWQSPKYFFGSKRYEATLINTSEYGTWVNDGHFQEVGRYVAQIGRRLVRPYVPGLHFVEDSLEYSENNLETKLKSEYQSRINDLEGN